MEQNSYFRGFLAVKISKSLEDEIRRYQESFKKENLGCKWVDPRNIHLTLNFLGNIEYKLAASITDNLSTLLKKIDPFVIKLGRVGVFPNVKRPSVFWIGTMFGGDNLKKIKEICDNAIVDFGFKKEGREFNPHFTIGRFKGPANTMRMEQILERDRSKVFGEFEVERVILFKSDLKAYGPEYSEFSLIEF